jgi:hypothetical protein
MKYALNAILVLTAALIIGFLSRNFFIHKLAFAQHDEPETITLLLPYYLGEEFSKFFKSLGFKVLCAETYQELEKLVETNQIDLAIEWQHGERDFTVRDLIRRYNKQAKTFLFLNWNNKKPSDFDELGYCDVLEVPFKIKSMRVKFYNALPPAKKKIFKQLPIWAE